MDKCDLFTDPKMSKLLDQFRGCMVGGLVGEYIGNKRLEFKSKGFLICKSVVLA